MNEKNICLEGFIFCKGIERYQCYKCYTFPRTFKVINRCPVIYLIIITHLYRTEKFTFAKFIWIYFWEVKRSLKEEFFLYGNTHKSRYRGGMSPPWILSPPEWFRGGTVILSPPWAIQGEDKYLFFKFDISKIDLSKQKVMVYTNIAFFCCRLENKKLPPPRLKLCKCQKKWTKPVQWFS